MRQPPVVFQSRRGSLWLGLLVRLLPFHRSGPATASGVQGQPRLPDFKGRRCAAGLGIELSEGSLSADGGAGPVGQRLAHRLDQFPARYSPGRLVSARACLRSTRPSFDYAVKSSDRPRIPSNGEQCLFVSAEGTSGGARNVFLFCQHFALDHSTRVWLNLKMRMIMLSKKAALSITFGLIFLGSFLKPPPYRLPREVARASLASS